VPISVPVPARSPGDLLTSALWNAQVKDNINKLLDRGHRVLTVAQFNALTGLEDGDEAYVEVDSSNGIVWHLRYHLSTTKWRFLGGAPLRSIVETSEATTSTTAVDLATVGPSITMPAITVNVDYDIFYGARHAGPSITFLKMGAAAAGDTIGGGTSTAGSESSCRRIVKTAVATSTVIKIQYASADGISRAFDSRWLFIEPARVG
jgi:hypothetical protein